MYQNYDCYRDTYDFGGGATRGGDGNICAWNGSPMTRYGLASNPTYCGSGRRVRVP